jgi:ankyrin repeat protein
MFEELLEMGVPADPPDSALRDNMGLGRATPLGAAVAASGECLPIVRRLIALGVDVNRRQSLGGSPPLVDAAVANNQRTVELLIEAGADINATNRDGETALDQARELDHDGLAAWLEAHGAEQGAGSADAASAD